MIQGPQTDVISYKRVETCLRSENPKSLHSQPQQHKSPLPHASGAAARGPAASAAAACARVRGVPAAAAETQRVAARAPHLRLGSAAASWALQGAALALWCARVALGGEQARASRDASRCYP